MQAEALGLLERPSLTIRRSKPPRTTRAPAWPRRANAKTSLPAHRPTVNHAAAQPQQLPPHAHTEPACTRNRSHQAITTTEALEHLAAAREVLHVTARRSAHSFRDL